MKRKEKKGEDEQAGKGKGGEEGCARAHKRVSDDTKAIMKGKEEEKAMRGQARTHVAHLARHGLPGSKYTN